MSDQQQPDPWATVDEILAQCTRRHDGGQSVQPSVYSMSISTAKALRQAIDYARAEVERRNAEETERLKALAEAWREAYEGTEHAALYEEWQHEREAQREALDALKATHEATLAAVGRSHAQALEKLKAEIARLEAEAASFHMSYRIKADADSKAALIRAEQAESERDTLRAQLAAVQKERDQAIEWVRVGIVTLRSNDCRPARRIAADTAAQMDEWLSSKPLTLKEPKA